VANNASRYQQNNRLNWMKGTTYPAAPATTYVALLTTMPTDNNGTGIAEVSGGAYARIGVTSSTGWSAVSTSGSLQQMGNAAAVTFTTATANWGTIVGVAIYDALTTGNMLYFAPLAANQVVNNGNTFSFLAGALVIQED
jgi:hypothetical protein